MACLAERDGRYLLVEEHTPEGLRLNNPAGHLEPGESLVQAAAPGDYELSMELRIYRERPAVARRNKPVALALWDFLASQRLSANP